MRTNLAFKDGDGGGDAPEIHWLSMTDEEALFLLSVVEGFDDAEAVTLRNRLRIVCGVPTLWLAIDNTQRVT